MYLQILLSTIVFSTQFREETEPPGSEDIVSRKIEYDNITLVSHLHRGLIQ